MAPIYNLWTWSTRSVIDIFSPSLEFSSKLLISYAMSGQSPVASLDTLIMRADRLIGREESHSQRYKSRFRRIRRNE